MMSSRSRSGGASSRVWGRVWRPVCVKAPDIVNVFLFVFSFYFTSVLVCDCDCWVYVDYAMLAARNVSGDSDCVCFESKTIYPHLINV